MNQSSYITVFILVGFLVFITIRGELPQYKAAIFGGSSAATTSDAATTAAVNTMTSLPGLSSLPSF